jgi:Phosphotransferase system, mannose/fructose-specific component IIA
MRRIILASHGSLAEGMHSAAKMILGDHHNIHAYGLDQYETAQELLAAVQEAVADAADDEIFILCDIKGGSVHREMLQLLNENEDIKIITGMNLGMVLELCVSSSDTKDPENLNHILEAGKSDIICFDKALIRSMKERKEVDSLW